MRNITMGEWLAELGRVEAQVCAVWPELRLCVQHNTLSIDAPDRSMSASVALGLSSHRRSMIVRPAIGSSSCFPIGILEARARHHQVGRVLDAVTSAAYLLSDLEVWPDGAPCDFCGGRGQTRGQECDRCHGTGTRHDEP